VERKIRHNDFQQHLKEWYFVTLDSSLKNDYQKHHQTLTRTEITEKIKEVFN